MTVTGTPWASDGSRIRSRALASKVMSAEAAAARITPGTNVGMSGFTGARHPKVVPGALARRMEAASAAGDPSGR